MMSISFLYADLDNDAPFIKAPTAAQALEVVLALEAALALAAAQAS